ncbi:hypothetical protein HMPREF1861_02130 [Corynebacterium kroppenstedtii]|nr:hypothetical protein HMPREF1861_02130 [Corynebacterium kroppenstedtii]
MYIIFELFRVKIRSGFWLLTQRCFRAYPHVFYGKTVAPAM